MFNIIKPTGYKKLSKIDKLRICNGTGAKGTPKIITNFLDNFFGWGMDLSKASKVHDYCYYAWKTWVGKIIADLLYLWNMFIICIDSIFKKPFSNIIGSLILFPIRALKSLIYFLAVLIFGWKAFKNK